jgi:threonine dehydrogenase-like Zn-dependent dehydrogenase
MRAAVYRAPGDIALEDRDGDVLDEDELLVDVRAASLCGTDLRIFNKGHFKIPTPTRRVLGHEVAGTIARVGRRVAGFRPGMRVSFTPNIGCGLCEMCRQGYNNMCPDYEAFGISVDGGFQDRMRVPAAAIRGGNVFEIPDGLSFEEAAVVEPLSCCYNAFKGLDVSPEATVLVIGPGPIGACFVQLARAWGARSVIVAGRSEGRLAEIERFGADVLINTTKQDLRAAIAALTKGRGVDVVVTAASAPELQPLAVELLATHGRVNFFGGLAHGMTVPIDTNRVHYRGLKLTGTTGSSNEDYDRSLRLAATGKVNLKDIVSHRFDLSDIARAFETAASGKAMKTMIVADAH